VAPGHRGGADRGHQWRWAVRVVQRLPRWLGLWREVKEAGGAGDEGNVVKNSRGGEEMGEGGKREGFNGFKIPLCSSVATSLMNVRGSCHVYTTPYVHWFDTSLRNINMFVSDVSIRRT
jgi:hypothetical protein